MCGCLCLPWMEVVTRKVKCNDNDNIASLLKGGLMNILLSLFFAIEDHNCTQKHLVHLQSKA